MIVLYIDTSSSYLYASLVKEKECIAKVIEEYGQSLSEVTLPKIVEMFHQNNLSPKDVDKIIVVNGPGSFTGTRIGVTIAKVYAWSTNIPITTITSLEAMAISSKSNKIHVPMINARRNYVYAAIYDKDYNVLLKPQHLPLVELQEKLKDIQDYEYISNDEFEGDFMINSYTPDFVKIVDYCKDKKAMNPHAVNPEYLKLTEAEESKL